MNIWMPLLQLFGYIAIVGAVFTAISFVIHRMGYGSPRKFNVPVALVQHFTGALFVFSGFIKAIDPKGTALKMNEYFDALNIQFFKPMSMSFSVFMIVLEIVLGILLIKGAWRKPVTVLLLLTIIFFTFLTGYTTVTGEVTDCGCFGEFMKLKPRVSFGKDLVLLVFTLFLLFRRNHIVEYLRGMWAWIVASVLSIASLVFCLSNFAWNEPVLDFRPFANGININEAREKCEKDMPIIKQTFVYKNVTDGKEVKVTAEALVKQENSYLWDANVWKIQSDKTIRVVEHEGCNSKVKEFHFNDKEGSEYTDLITENPKYNIAVLIDGVNKIDREMFKKKIIPFVNEAMGKDSLQVLALTNSTYEESEPFRHDVQAAFPFYTMDTKVIQTIMRSNPGVVLFGNNGTIIHKWHWKQLPTYSKVKEKYMK